MERKTLVRPRSAAQIDDNATFVSNYVCMRPVRDVQMYPVAYCKGDNSRVSFNSILYGHKNSQLDTGSKAVLTGRGQQSRNGQPSHRPRRLKNDRPRHD